MRGHLSAVILCHWNNVMWEESTIQRQEWHCLLLRGWPGSKWLACSHLCTICSYGPPCLEPLFVPSFPNQSFPSFQTSPNPSPEGQRHLCFFSALWLTQSLMHLFNKYWLSVCSNILGCKEPKPEIHRFKQMSVNFPYITKRHLWTGFGSASRDNLGLSSIAVKPDYQITSPAFRRLGPHSKQEEEKGEISSIKVSRFRKPVFPRTPGRLYKQLYSCLTDR